MHRIGTALLGLRSNKSAHQKPAVWSPLRERRAWCGEFGTSSVVCGLREVRHASRSPGSSREVHSSVLETISTLTPVAVVIDNDNDADEM